MDVFQMIPLLALTAYFFYLSYYYAAPMFRLKVMLFYAHIRYRGIDVRFTDGRITATVGERAFERGLETDPTSRFFPASVCSQFRKLLKDIRQGTIRESEVSNGLSTGERTCGAGRQGAEEDCD